MWLKTYGVDVMDTHNKHGDKVIVDDINLEGVKYNWDPKRVILVEIFN